jgi:hypothetical protein
VVAFPGVLEDLDADLFEDVLLVGVLVAGAAKWVSTYTKYPFSSGSNSSCDQKE